MNAMILEDMRAVALVDKIDKCKAAVLSRFSVVGNVDAGNWTKGTKQILDDTSRAQVGQ